MIYIVYLPVSRFLYDFSDNVSTRFVLGIQNRISFLPLPSFFLSSATDFVVM